MLCCRTDRTADSHSCSHTKYFMFQKVKGLLTHTLFVTKLKEKNQAQKTKPKPRCEGRTKEAPRRSGYTPRAERTLSNSRLDPVPLFSGALSKSRLDVIALFSGALRRVGWTQRHSLSVGALSKSRLDPMALFSEALSKTRLDPKALSFSLPASN